MFNGGIELIYDQIQTKFENDCVQAVQRYGFNIDKDRLQKALTESRGFYDEGYADAKKEFERLPGEWINHRNDHGHNIADCSECGKATQWHDEDEDGVPRYCWFCGAKMEVKNNGR